MLKWNGPKHEMEITQNDRLYAKISFEIIFNLIWHAQVLYRNLKQNSLPSIPQHRFYRGK